jgi:ribose transport system substrate-binding protein
MSVSLGGVLGRWSALVALLAVSVVVGCGEDQPSSDGSASNGKTKRIIILTNAVSPYWDAADIGAQNAAKELNVADSNYTVTIEKNTKKTEGQVTQLKQYLGAADVAAVAISVTDPNNQQLMRAMKQLRDSGVVVVTIDSDVDRSKFSNTRFAYIGTDNVVGGKELGQTVKGLLPNGGKYATFVGIKSQGNAIERNDGFDEGVGEKFTRVENLGDDVDDNKARKNVRDAYDRNNDIVAYVGIWSYNTPAIVDIVSELKIQDKVKVVGFDADPPSIVAMGEGKVDAMVVQNPYEMGYQSVRLMKALLTDDTDTVNEMLPNHSESGGDIYDTGLRVVVPDENSPLKESDFRKTTEFMTLKEFQSWLDKYALTGS